MVKAAGSVARQLPHHVRLVRSPHHQQAHYDPSKKSRKDQACIAKVALGFDLGGGVGVARRTPRTSDAIMSVLHQRVTMDNTISRRRAAKLIGATAVAAFLPIGASRLFAVGESSQRIMRAIPSTHEKLPVIGLGSALTFDVRGSRQLAPIGEVLALFVKHGGKLIDTSPAYGSAESVIGDLAYKEHLTSSLFFATKVWTRDKQEGISQMQRSLERFRTRSIDLEQVHNLADVDRQMTSLREWKAKGQIRYTGITYSEDRGHGEVERACRPRNPISCRSIIR